MRRREFMVLVGSAVAWPVVARAQQPMPVVGFLNGGSPHQYVDRVRAFRQGLGDLGYVEGRNLAIEFRWANGQTDRLPELAAELVHRQVAVIAATGGPPPALAAKAATNIIPIVFIVGSDPVNLGLVGSLNRPGANITGITNLAIELGQKRVELLHEAVPAATTFALLVNPASTANAATLSRDMQSAARNFGLDVHVVEASTERDFDSVFASLKSKASALVIGADAFFNSRSEQLGALTSRHAVPSIFQSREFVTAGGLMSYGGSGDWAYHQVGVYTGRVLKGERPSELPVQQTTKAPLTINLKTAKALGLTVPTALLVRADEVIE